MGRDAPANPGVIGIDESALRRWPLPRPDGDGDKEERGRVLIIAGSREIPGAAVLAATAALRAGAGKLTVGAPASIAQSIAFAVPESRVIALEESAAGGIAPDAASALYEIAGEVGAVLIGPGLPYHSATYDLAAALLDKCGDAQIVLDAGAMRTACMPHLVGATRFAVPVLLTPHAGEMASLTGKDKGSIVADPLAAATAAAREWNAVVALKGAATFIVTPGGLAWRHDADNPGLATSGSGDVLAGIIVGLLARGAALEQAAAWGVALHAHAGARLARSIGPLGFLARELSAELPALMAALAAP